MPFICCGFFALTYLLILLGAAQAQSVINIGETPVLSAADSGNGNLLLAQNATLAQAATIQSLSFYVTAATGSLILGIYDATGPKGGPGVLEASTNSFTPVKGWNTANVVTPVSLAAGNYWLAYLPSSNSLRFRKTNASGNCAYYGYTFGSLPSNFSASPTSCTPTTWSFYATLTLPSSGVANGACGPSNGADLTSAPTTNLCSAGTASSVSGSGPWNWMCAGSGGGTTASCSALLEIVGTCGSANGVAVSTAPTANLCSAGTASTVAGSGPWTWSCAGSNGGATGMCWAPTTSAFNGVCGSANGATVSTAPTANLCSAGTASTVAGSGPWTWSCVGGNGGATAVCSDTLASTGAGDPTSGVLPSYDDAYANWKKAGLQSIGGIPTRSTQCGSTVSPSGLTPPTSGDDADTINSAITACTAGDVVQLSSGKFQIAQSEYIALNKGVTLRGNGSCTNASSPYCNTVINVYNGAIADWAISSTMTGANCGVTSASVSTCTEATAAILMSPSSNWNWGWAGCNLGTTPTGCGTLLDVDAAQGQTTIQVHSTSNFSVGMWVLIDENPEVVSTKNPTGGANVEASSDWLNSSGSPATMRLEGGDEATSYSFNPNRLNAEIHKVTAIGAGPCPGSACTLTFDSPLTLAFRESGSHDARVYWPTVQGATANPFLQEAGVENLTITKAANSGIQMAFCAYCWVKNVEVGTWIAGAVNVDYSARAQIEFNYFHDGADLENNGSEYPIGINSASTETLVTNNIIRVGGKGMVGRGANSAVVSYNYVDDTMYMKSSIGDYWLDMDVNGSHYAGTHHFLFEGNWGNNCDSDETHGNAIYHTFFRNDCTGIRTTFVDPSNSKTVDDATNTAWGNAGVATAPAPLRAAGPMAFDYWFAFSGNVLGLTGVTTSGNGWAYQCAFGATSGQTNKCIWMSGWVGSEWPAPDPHLTSNSYIFKNCNYDYVHGSVADCAGGSYSSTLPNSFYLSGAPAFFGAGSGYPWPWVTPTGSQPIQTGPSGCGGTCSALPAKARYDAGTPFTQP